MSKPSALRGSASRIFSITISGKSKISENSSKFNSPLLSLSADLKSFAIWASVNAMCDSPEAAANASNFLYASVNSLKKVVHLGSYRVL